MLSIPSAWNVLPYSHMAHPSLHLNLSSERLPLTVTPMWHSTPFHSLSAQPALCGYISHESPHDTAGMFIWFVSASPMRTSAACLSCSPCRCSTCGQPWEKGELTAGLSGYHFTRPSLPHRQEQSCCPHWLLSSSGNSLPGPLRALCHAQCGQASAGWTTGAWTALFQRGLPLQKVMTKEPHLCSLTQAGVPLAGPVLAWQESSVTSN